MESKICFSTSLELRDTIWKNNALCLGQNAQATLYSPQGGIEKFGRLEEHAVFGNAVSIPHWRKGFLAQRNFSEHALGIVSLMRAVLMRRFTSSTTFTNNAHLPGWRKEEKKYVQFVTISKITN
jgi:hypothetical protein